MTIGRPMRMARMGMARMVMALACMAAAMNSPLRAQGADPASGEMAAPPAEGNFLARVPLDTLTATRDRPLFAPSRRSSSPRQAVAPAAPFVPAPAEAGPQMTLLGIIRSTAKGGAAVVMDDTSQESLTLRPGDARRGWVVQSVDAGGAVVAKDGRSATLALPSATAAPPGGPATQPPGFAPPRGRFAPPPPGADAGPAP